MRLLLIILLFSSIAYAKEKDLACKSLIDDKVKHFIKASHYKCIFQNIKFEKNFIETLFTIFYLKISFAQTA